MFHFKSRKGFTLPEVLVALVIVGVISLLVVPALIKDINAKSNMSKLRSVATDLANVTEKEFVESRSEAFENTSVVQNPSDFLQNSFEYSAKGSPFAGKNSYYSNNGSKLSDSFSIPAAKVLLKNGTGIAIENKDSIKASRVLIDVNGSDKPNIAGIDLFELYIYWEDDYENNLYAGGVSSYVPDEEKSKSDLKTECDAGDPASCYKLAELTGFDPDYISKDYNSEN